MFTGLIEAVGSVVGIKPRGQSVEICVKPDDAENFNINVGGSVAIDGVCLTVEKRSRNGLMFFTAVAETLKRTTLNHIVPGRIVNLERAMCANGRFDGHFVLGHIDTVGRIVCDEDVGGGVVRTISIPSESLPFAAEKGSIAIDGISLTIAKVKDNTISLSLIPATVAKTAMAVKKVGDGVNIEYDVLARYIYNAMKAGGNIAVKKENLKSEKSALIDKMERLGF